MTYQDQANSLNTAIIIIGAVTALLFAFSSKEFRGHWIKWVGTFLSIIIIILGLRQHSVSAHIDEENQKKEKKDSIERVLTKKSFDEKLDQQQKSLEHANCKLDEKDEMTKNLVKQTTNLTITAKELSIDQHLLQDKHQELIDEATRRKQTEERQRKSIIAAKNGVFKTFKFNGVTLSSGKNGMPSYSAKSGDASQFFYKFDKPISSKNAKGLLDTAELGIKLFPDWMTPYWFKGLALLTLNRKSEALELFNFIEENTTGDN